MAQAPRPILAWVSAVAAPSAATVAALLLDRAMSVAGLSMLYLAASVGCALWLPRAQALVATVLCVSALNFFFVPPRFSFAVDGAEYWWTLAVLLATSLLLQVLVASVRARRAQAEQAAAQAGELHALGAVLAEVDGADAMAQAAAAWLHGTLALPAAVFLGRDAAACFASGADAQRFDARTAQWAIEHGRPLGRGTDDWRDLPVWGAPFARHGARGAVLVLLGARDAVDRDRAAHWEALVRQIGLAIERERAGAEAAEARELAQAQDARNVLLASLSHDLRTPLAGILGSASTLREQGASLSAAERDRLLASVEDEARDLTAMAENVLQMARLSQPQRELRRDWESVDEVLGTAVARARRRWPRARIELRSSGSLPPVLGEAGLLAQLAGNLVDNAVRHGGGEPHVVVRTGRARGGVFIAVRDHGAGLPPGDEQALFDRAGAPGRAGGAGLGLALCSLIAHAHGGSISARRCEPGAEFRVDLPAPDPEPADAA